MRVAGSPARDTILVLLTSEEDGESIDVKECGVVFAMLCGGDDAGSKFEFAAELFDLRSLRAGGSGGGAGLGFVVQCYGMMRPFWMIGMHVSPSHAGSFPDCPRALAAKSSAFRSDFPRALAVKSSAFRHLREVAVPAVQVAASLLRTYLNCVNSSPKTVQVGLPTDSLCGKHRLSSIMLAPITSTISRARQQSRQRRPASV